MCLYYISIVQYNFHFGLRLQWVLLCHDCCITLASVPGKVFAHVLLSRVRERLQSRRRVQQSGFTPHRSTIDRIITLQLVLQTRPKHGPLHDSWRGISMHFTNGACVAYYEFLGGPAFLMKRFADAPTSHHSHRSFIPLVWSSLATLLALMLPWTTAVPFGPVWPLCQGTGTVVRADHDTLGYGPLNLTWRPEHWSGNCLSPSSESASMDQARRNGNVHHRTSHMMMMMMMLHSISILNLHILCLLCVMLSVSWYLQEM